MNYFLNGKSSWGHKVHEINVRSVKRTNRVLRLLNEVGEKACIPISIIIVICMLYFLIFTNFEYVIFYDGTNDICVLSDTTNGVSHVEAR